jgi:hypothetical protein
MTRDIEEQQIATIYTPTYKTVPKYPLPGKDALATIYFHGLLALCFNGENECIVGVNNKAPMHKAEVQVLQVGEPPCSKISGWLPSGFKEMTIEVTDKAGTPVKSGVWVYAPVNTKGDPDPAATGGRYSYVYYGLDMEGPEIHDKLLPKEPGALSPRFRIKNGLFYTSEISLSEFVLQYHTMDKPKQVGLVLAADIHLDTTKDEKITLTCDIGPKPCLTLPVIKGKRYEIAITNSCGPRDVTGTSVIDFQMNYEVIAKTAPEYGDRFNLERTRTSTVTGPITFGACDIGAPFSDPVPCLPVTFGRSTDLD